MYLNVCDVGFEKWSGGPGVLEIVRNYLINVWPGTRIIYLLMPLRSKLALPRQSQVQNIGTEKENFQILLL